MAEGRGGVADGAPTLLAFLHQQRRLLIREAEDNSELTRRGWRHARRATSRCWASSAAPPRSNGAGHVGRSRVERRTASMSATPIPKGTSIPPAPPSPRRWRPSGRNRMPPTGSIERQDPATRWNAAIPGCAACAGPWSPHRSVRPSLRPCRPHQGGLTTARPASDRAPSPRRSTGEHAPDSRPSMRV